MHGGRKNVPYLPDEEEEEDDAAEVEQGQETGKVTVRTLPKVVSPVNWVQNGLMVVGEGGHTVSLVATTCRSLQHVVNLISAILGLYNTGRKTSHPVMVGEPDDWFQWGFCLCPDL